MQCPKQKRRLSKNTYVVVNIKNKEILFALEVTDEKVHDSVMLKKIESVLAEDGSPKIQTGILDILNIQESSLE
jgi:hypothetical protein